VSTAKAMNFVTRQSFEEDPLVLLDGVPLFDIEKQYLEKKGFPAFEQLIVDQGAYFHKLDREPYVVV